VTIRKDIINQFGQDENFLKNVLFDGSLFGTTILYRLRSQKKRDLRENDPYKNLILTETVKVV